LNDVEICCATTRRVNMHRELRCPSCHFGPETLADVFIIRPRRVGSKSQSSIAITMLNVYGPFISLMYPGLSNGDTAMGDLVKRLNGARRSPEDRRSGIDTRSDAEKESIGERRSGRDRRSDKDRRLSAAKPDPR
jgi:hypothetical protein